jgi:hypothetical protein
MRGLDPRIHADIAHGVRMDRRVKPGDGDDDSGCSSLFVMR